jgi:hypothetical protein
MNGDYARGVSLVSESSCLDSGRPLHALDTLHRSNKGDHMKEIT